VSFVRYNKKQDSALVFACNFTPVPRYNYQIGVPWEGFWHEILNSDAHIYGGSGMGNMGGVNSSPVPRHDRTHSLNITLPPLAVVVFRASNPAIQEVPVEERAQEESQKNSPDENSKPAKVKKPRAPRKTVKQNP
jgi:hypothetical protein